jgi:3-phenylpropionate/trans-cinnamate dioxygenase ferredoxin reductase subunit
LRDANRRCARYAAELDEIAGPPAPPPLITVPQMTDRIVIVGAGQAAAQLAQSLNQAGFAGAIHIIGDEPYPPYQRPPLSKKFLSERPPPDSLYFRPESFWRDKRVSLDLGTPVGGIDRRNRQVTLTDGRDIPYDTLVLATGTRARDLPMPGIDLAGVFSLRRIGDVLKLRPVLDEARRVVIVGGGYIGLEVAAVARGEGRDVTVLEAEDRVLKRVTSPVISQFFDEVHREHGVVLRLGARMAGIEGEGKVSAVRLADDTTLPADLVLVAVGARANDDLAAAAGLDCQDGVLVDEFARTADPAIYAAGDCTRFPSRRYGRRLRLECVQNAIDQAKAVAAAILGDPAPYDPVPWFWSDQYDIKLQMAGLSEGYETADTIGDRAQRKFSVEYRRDGRLIAVDAVNDGRAYMMGRKRVGQETELAAAPVSS